MYQFHSAYINDSESFGTPIVILAASRRSKNFSILMPLCLSLIFWIFEAVKFLIDSTVLYSKSNDNADFDNFPSKNPLNSGKMQSKQFVTVTNWLLLSRTILFLFLVKDFSSSQGYNLDW